MLTQRSGLRCVSLRPVVAFTSTKACVRHHVCCRCLTLQGLKKLDGSADSDRSPNLSACCVLQVWVKQMGSMDRLLAAAELPAAALLSLADSPCHSGGTLGCDEAAVQRQALAAPACSALSADHRYCAKDLAIEMVLAEGLSSAAEGSGHQGRQTATASQLLLHVSLRYTCSPVQADQGGEQSAQSVQSMPVQDAADVAPAGALWQVHEQEGAQEDARFLDLGEKPSPLLPHQKTPSCASWALLCQRMLYIQVLHALYRPRLPMRILQQAADFWRSHDIVGMGCLPLRSQGFPPILTPLQGRMWHHQQSPRRPLCSWRSSERLAFWML